jgi:hypothetical protein
MAPRDDIRQRRDSAFSINLGVSSEDKVMEMISRRDGLYAVSLDKIIRVNLPDDADPAMQHANAPITQTLIVENGSRSSIVARAILQAKDFSRLFPAQEKQERMQDIAWEVMFSLLAMDRIVTHLNTSIESKKATISEDYSRYVTGASPPPPPIVEDLELQFRSAVLISNHAVNTISELFSVFFDVNFRRGAFDRITSWSSQRFGKDDVLTLMLEGDHRWINTWGEVRNAFEHPKEDYYVKVNNFRLLPDRQIQSPTWQLKHPKLDLFRPQDLVGQLRIHQSNILGLFENLLVLLVDKAASLPVPVALIDKKETDRDPDCPKRYDLQFVIPVPPKSK